MNIYHTRLGPIATNCYIVADDQKNAAIVDPGADAARVIEILKDKGLTPKAVLLTHGHFDHIGGVKGLTKAYPDITVTIGEKDAPMLGLGLDKRKWGDFANAEDYDNLSASRLLNEGDVVTVGSLEFAVLDTPGHTRGGVCYLCEDFIFSGDTLFRFECGRTDLDGGDYPTILRSLKKLHDLPGNWKVLPGHEEVSTLEEERQGNPYMREALR